MPDKTTRTRQLKLVASFTDGDYRTITTKNPKRSLTKKNFAADTELTKAAAQALVGDKLGAAFNGWKSAKIIEQTFKFFDLRKEQ